jgi:hypothetical protein
VLRFSRVRDPRRLQLCSTPTSLICSMLTLTDIPDETATSIAPECVYNGREWSFRGHGTMYSTYNQPRVTVVIVRNRKALTVVSIHTFRDTALSLSNIVACIYYRTSSVIKYIYRWRLLIHSLVILSFYKMLSLNNSVLITGWKSCWV